MDLLRNLIRGLGFLFLAPLIALPVLAAQSPGPSSQPDAVQPPGPSSKPGGPVRALTNRAGLPFFVILGTPADLPALLQKIPHPDLEVRQVDRPTAEEVLTGVPDVPLSQPLGVVESVRVQGRIVEDFAILKVLMLIVTNSDGPSWVPIHLDDQKLTAAREGSRELPLRTVRRSQWQVELTGRGRHRVEVDLRAAVMAKPARKALSLAIPEAAFNLRQRGLRPPRVGPHHWNQ